MAVTISDVANEAGVSKSTVSKVLNGWTTISDETKQRIYDAIEKLNYIPNARAVNFARKVTKNVVYLTDLGKGTAFHNPHMFDIMCGVHNRLSSEGYTMELIDISNESYPGEKGIQEINRRSADGLIVHGSAINEELAKRLVEEEIPHIIIGSPAYNNRLCWIDTDHTLAGEFAANYLVERGYQNIMFVGGRRSDQISNMRLTGAKRGLLNHRLKLHSSKIVYTGSTREGAYESTKNMLLDILNAEQHKTDPNLIGNGNYTGLPDSIICENNLIALGVSKAISECGLHVPEDIGLITFDKYPYSYIIDPQPTVVDIDMYDMGIQAGDTLIRKLNNPRLMIQSFTTLPLIIPGASTK